MNKFSYIILTTLCLLFVTQEVSAIDKDGNFVLVIDPGHGGKDPGAVNGKNQEKTINLNVALKMGKLIEDNCKNVKVIYTRKTDVFVELYKRADIANKEPLPGQQPQELLPPWEPHRIRPRCKRRRKQP